MSVEQNHDRVKNSKILISAYACRPDKGSEPGVGWNMAVELVKHAKEVWVITRTENRSSIEAEITQNPIPGLNFVYYDLPAWAKWWKKGERGLHLHYYLWQIGTYSLARRLHNQVGFSLAHHVTYGRYCAPSSLSLMPVPFVWGPVGGGEVAPNSFRGGFSFNGKVYETLRDVSRWIGEHDPFVYVTAKRSAVVIVATPETKACLQALGTKRIETISGQTGINQEQIDQFEKLATTSVETRVRFISMGRLLHWKGFHLGVEAFAKANLAGSEYWILGDGPERSRLEALAKKLKIDDKVRFFGVVPREEALNKLGQCTALVHPSLHDFSPTVCIEGMAAGRPVICLDLGGPATQITEETGFKVSAKTPDEAISGMAEAMCTLAKDSELRLRMGEAGRKRVSESYSWEVKGQFLKNLYEEVLERA